MAVVDPAAFTAFDSTGAGGGQQAGFLVSQCPVVFTVQNHYKAHCSELLSECLAGADGRDQGAAGVRGDDFGGGAAHAQQILKNVQQQMGQLQCTIYSNIRNLGPGVK